MQYSNLTNDEALNFLQSDMGKSSAGFAAQSLLAALGSIQFVSNVFFASAVLGEKVRHSNLCL